MTQTFKIVMMKIQTHLRCLVLTPPLTRNNGLISASEDEDSDGELQLHCKQQMYIHFPALSTTIQRNQTPVSIKHKFLSQKNARVPT